MVALAIAVVLLTVSAVLEDRADEPHRLAEADQRRHAERALELARLGGLDAAGTIPLLEGEKLFHEKGCASCHLREHDALARRSPAAPSGAAAPPSPGPPPTSSRPQESGESPSGSHPAPTSPPPDRTPSTPIPASGLGQAPDLAGWGSVDRIARFLADPDAFFRTTKLRGAMEPFPGSDDERLQVASWLASLSGRHPVAPEVEAEARRLFDVHGCPDCHNPPTGSPRDKGWDPTALGPDLAGFASYEWTRGLILDASHPRFFGDALTEAELPESMPPFPDLAPSEVHLLTLYVLSPALATAAHPPRRE